MKSKSHYWKKMLQFFFSLRMEIKMIELFIPCWVPNLITEHILSTRKRVLMYNFKYKWGKVNLMDYLLCLFFIYFLSARFSAFTFLSCQVIPILKCLIYVYVDAGNIFYLSIWEYFKNQKLTLEVKFLKE